MSPLADIQSLLLSDAGTASVADLTTLFGLWVRNSLIHIGFGFVGLVVLWAFPRLWLWALAAMVAYGWLQVIQVFTSPGLVLALVFDGFWDVVSVWVGAAFAWAILARGAGR